MGMKNHAEPAGRACVVRVSFGIGQRGFDDKANGGKKRGGGDIRQRRERLVRAAAHKKKDDEEKDCAGQYVASTSCAEAAAARGPASCRFRAPGPCLRKYPWPSGRIRIYCGSFRRRRS